MRWTEILGERVDPQSAGTVRLNATYETRKKPVWLVLLKLSGLVAMVAIGFLLIVPPLPLPVWQSCALAAGIMLLYVGIAFFVRPEPNTDNLGWGGGAFNDPTQYSDNINRMLWKVHCFLGPGRFVAETILDTCTLLGLTRELDHERHEAEIAARQCRAEDQRRKVLLDRVQTRRAEGYDGTQQLASTRFLDPDRFDS